MTFALYASIAAAAGFPLGYALVPAWCWYSQLVDDVFSTFDWAWEAYLPGEETLP